MPSPDKDVLIQGMLSEKQLQTSDKPTPDSKEWWEEVAKGLGVKLFDANRELSSIDAILSRRPALDLPTRWQNIEKAITVAARCDKAEAIVADAKAQNERLVERVQQAEQARDEMREDRQRAIEDLYKLDTERAEQISALTQALKDYGTHKVGCPNRPSVTFDPLYGSGCSCGLDAALTGAQA